MTLPPLDAHAHIVPQIAPAQLAELNACVIAVTRSLEEFKSVVHRADPNTAWALGCHPSLARAQRAYSPERFAQMLRRAAVIGEVGIDGTSRVPIETQRAVFRGVLAAALEAPRIISVHSFRSTGEVLDELEDHAPGGVVLHWWLGSRSETRRAVDLGSYFSVNSSSVRREDVMSEIPLNRVLTETDHPYGDRYRGGSTRPGRVDDVELALARRYGTAPTETRLRVWQNFRTVVRQTHTEPLLPREIHSLLAMIT